MIICGLDEAGRGPLAGDVTAGAVILGKDFPLEILNDSKKLTHKKREAAYEIIMEKAEAAASGWVSPQEIDEINIHQASLLAMKRAYERMIHKYESKEIKCFSDGKFCPDVEPECEAIIGGDAIVPEIMAASIVAKVERDRYMLEMAKKYPEYLFEKHKGYPTKLHREKCREHGICPIHRKSFKKF